MNKHIHSYPIPTICDYCDSSVVLSSNAEIYGKEYGSGKCYRCTSCDAYVGVHKGTVIPYGRLADKELRDLKMECHKLFDPAWINNKWNSRQQAYGKLATLLEVPIEKCHFGFFDRDTLKYCLEIMSDEKWYIGVEWKKDVA